MCTGPKTVLMTTIDESVCVWCTCGLEDARIALAVPGGECLHHTINLLGFTGESEAPQKLPATAGTERDAV